MWNGTEWKGDNEIMADALGEVIQEMAADDGEPSYDQTDE